MSASPFGSRALLVLVAVCGGSLLIGLVLGALGTDLTGHRSAGNDSFSRSALGHRGFVELLREMDVPVGVHLGSDDTSRRYAAVLVAEPRFDGRDDPHVGNWHEMLDDFGGVLVVLPKRVGAPDLGRPDWIDRNWLRGTDAVQRTLDALGIDAHVVRLAGGRAPAWTTTLAGRRAPELRDAQLLQGDDLEPIWEAAEGVLAARWHDDDHPETDVIILADPDLLANHGLVRGDNAEYALQLVHDLVAVGDGLAVDETLHGYTNEQSLWRNFFRFPLSLVLLQLVLAGGALAWLAVGRFGADEPLPPPPTGHGSLVASTADLLRLGGHDRRLLESYLAAAQRAVVRDLRFDQRLSPVEARRALLRVGRARGVTRDLAAVEQRVRDAVADPRTPGGAVLAVAVDIHRWQQEMTHGLY